ncbi:MAG: hypothetical protein IPO09_09175 [Anaeromyxobacter sp.]|nr:hypothetical protein [Anaeromyxobacter sp.]MBL0277596.1 hypothetical protein [Anaeromyxobacter sp.]
MSRSPVTLALGLLLALPAAAAQFPARSAESGLLDVPDAEVAEPGSGLLGAELRFDRYPGQPSDFGPLPLYVVAGLGRSLEAGLSMREWGQPGDPRPARLTFGFATKLQLLAPRGGLPGVAVDASLDRFNADAVGGARLLLSTRADARLRLAAFAGAETEPGRLGGVGATYGAALAVKTAPTFEVVGEALGGPRGANLGLGLRWSARPTVGLQLGLNYFPEDQAFRVSLGVALSPVRAPAPAARLEPAAAPVQAEEAPMVAYAEDRPRFRLRIPTFGPDLLGQPRHQQHAPYAPPLAAAGAPPRLAAPPRAGVVTAGDLAESQLREQEALADTRLRSLRTGDDGLAGREQAAQAATRLLAERAEALTAREQQLDAREKRIQLRGVPTQAQRALESQEAQLSAAERQLAATERGFAPTLDAALGSERDAAGREQAERSERERLSALAGLEKAKPRQLELRRQALAAARRIAAAAEARLLAKGERVDALEKQVATRTERLDTWRRRVDARTARLDLMEQRAEEQRRGVAAAPALPPAVPALPGAPKDRAVFVMVVKSPTAIMKEPVARAPGAPERREAVHPGVAVEKAVAAATVVTFTSPTSQLSELDREAIDAIARLAAREGTEVLIWARAKDASLMSEAIRRSEELKSYVITTGKLSPRQVVTRITTRPGAQGVDVVVSALREGSRTAPPAQPAAPAPTGGAPAPLADKLGSSETTRRRIRDAVVAVQPSIEACVSDQMIRRSLKSADGTLRLTVSAQGRVTEVTAGSGPLSGPELDECLRQASAAWIFPPADTDYEVSVPVTVVGAGAKK